jgi:hypothetical protein
MFGNPDLDKAQPADALQDVLKPLEYKILEYPVASDLRNRGHLSGNSRPSGTRP